MTAAAREYYKKSFVFCDATRKIDDTFAGAKVGRWVSRQYNFAAYNSHAGRASGRAAGNKTGGWGG